MLGLFLQGLSLGLPPAVMPSPYKIFLITLSLRDGWKRTLPLCLAPLLADIPIVTLVLIVLSQVPAWLLAVLQIGGGLYMLLLARRIFIFWRRGGMSMLAAPGGMRQNLGQALLLILTSPNPYLVWSLVAGPILLGAISQSIWWAIGFLIGMYGVFILGLGLLVTAIGAAGGASARTNQGLTLASAIALLGFGLYQLYAGLMRLAA